MVNKRRQIHWFEKQAFYLQMIETTTIVNKYMLYTRTNM